MPCFRRALVLRLLRASGVARLAARLAPAAALVACAAMAPACAAVLGIEERVLDDGAMGSGPPATGERQTDSPREEEDGGPLAAGDAQGNAGDAAAGPPLTCGAAPVPTCGGCVSGAAACGGRCVSDCGACDGSLGCFACTGGVVSGTCEPATVAARCIAQPAYEHCPCLDASTCPGANQVCVAGECRTCGEPDTAGEVCRDGTGRKICKAATDPDPAKRLRCR